MSAAKDMGQCCSLSSALQPSCKLKNEQKYKQKQEATESKFGPDNPSTETPNFVWVRLRLHKSFQIAHQLLYWYGEGHGGMLLLKSSLQPSFKLDGGVHTLGQNRNLDRPTPLPCKPCLGPPTLVQS
jgi:hypothetical protein